MVQIKNVRRDQEYVQVAICRVDIDLVQMKMYVARGGTFKW